MKNLLIRFLLKCLDFLKYKTSAIEVGVGVTLGSQDNLKDVLFRATVIASELDRNFMGYEPVNYRRIQLISKLTSEYPWLEGDKLTEIVNEVIG